ncbi:MAG: endopeptidase, partial [bacterium]|nr:endopeptidase [bacterium]
LAFRDTLHYATTRKVVGGVYPVSNDGTPPDGIEQAGYPMPYADVTEAAGQRFTDSGGNYPVCVDGPVSTTLTGEFIRIDDFCGALSESSTGDLDLGTSGGIDCDVPSGASAGDTHAARTAFYELNRVKETARGHLPANIWLRGQLTAVTDIPDFGFPEFNCNAFWDETTINFFTSGEAAP